MYYLVGKNGFVVVARSGIDYRTPHIEVATPYVSRIAAKIVAMKLDESKILVVRVEE